MGKLDQLAKTAAAAAVEEAVRQSTDRLPEGPTVSQPSPLPAPAASAPVLEPLPPTSPLQPTTAPKAANQLGGLAASEHTSPLTINLPASLIRRLRTRVASLEKKVSLSAYIEAALMQLLENPDDETVLRTYGASSRRQIPFVKS